MVEGVTTAPQAAPSGWRPDLRTSATFALFAATILYLSFDGGGYDLIVRNQVGLAVWWGVLVCAIAGVLPVRPMKRSAAAVLVAFAAFVAWTIVSTAYSQSAERSLDELSRVVCYFGVLVLAVSLLRDRARSVRLTVSAVAFAVAVVAWFAVLSRGLPGTFSAANQTANFLPGTRGRLGWPLNYWNALAALMALGLPLLLAIATSARARAAQGAAAAIPVVILCAYLTFSRGGLLAIAAGLIVYLAFTEDRLPKLLTALVVGLGGGILVLIASHSSAVENGLIDAAARHQGHRLLAAAVVVFFAVGFVQVGLGVLLGRFGRPAFLRVPPSRARKLLLGTVALALIVGVVAHGPAKLSHAWQQFKRPTAAALQTNSLSRFGSGERQPTLRLLAGCF